MLMISVVIFEIFLVTLSRQQISSCSKLGFKKLNLFSVCTVKKISFFISDGLNLFWFYLMFKIVLSTTPSIAPMMEKKKIEFTLATAEFHEKMKLINNRNREKLSTLKSTMASSMTGMPTF